MDKEDVTHIHDEILLHYNNNGILLKGNEIELFVVRWMDLESVIQSEISLKEKNKYHMLTHIYRI